MNLVINLQKIIEDSLFEPLHVVQDKIMSLCQTYVDEGLLKAFSINANFETFSNNSEIEVAYKLDEKKDYSTIKYMITLLEHENKN